MADSQIHVALAGNPNCGKTTLFNLITGANGYVGNWPGVTVEKKEAKLLSDKNVTITDLPGIYSLSPYSPEEQCSRDYLMSGEPDVVVQVVDATNLERNLYLALQVIETGLPVVVALNMADLVEKNGDKIDTDKLSKKLGCPVMMISALKNKGIKELFEQVKKSAASKGQVPEHKFDSSIEDVLTHIENNLPASVPANKRRYYAVKLFERDADACKLINLTKEKAARVEQLVAQCEQDCDDDAKSIITGERYKMVPKESKDLLAGHYGRLPGKVNEDVRKKCIGDTKVITHRYADDIPPELDKLREEMREWYQCEEDVLSYAMFPKVAPKFFEYRAAQQLKVDSTMLNKADKTMPV